MIRCSGVLCLPRRHVAAAAKAALDVITFRLTRTDRPHGRRTGIDGVIPPLNKSDSVGNASKDPKKGDAGGGLESWGEAMDGEDVPMEVLKDGSGILGVMRAHPSDARVQESGWRSLIAMDTGRGDVEKFFTGGDGQERRREMLKDCIERHGGDSEVAGRVAAMLERLVLSGDSGECEQGGVGSLGQARTCAGVVKTFRDGSCKGPRGRGPGAVVWILWSYWTAIIWAVLRV